jgi:DNA-binding transcriptional MerR regulator
MVYNGNQGGVTMEKYRAIPNGYMRVGELAKKGGVTVRTLQYYDKEGLLSPSGTSDGGFRLYTDKDMVRLTQILMMKDMGFSLGEIKKRLTSMDTPSDVVEVLREHTAQIRRQIAHLSESLDEIEALMAEVKQMESVDFKKFAIILVNLQMKNKHYWIVKYFDDDDVAKFADLMTMEEAEEFIKISNRLFDKASKFHKAGVLPESEEGQSLAKSFWDTTMEMTGGDLELLQKLNDIALSNQVNHSEEYKEALLFIGAALEVYFNNQSVSQSMEGDIFND